MTETLNDTLAGILDEARLLHYDTGSEESFVECGLCREWDGHKPTCPVPAIALWLDTAPEPAEDQ